MRRGIRPVVLERSDADALATEGAFLTLAPNGIRALGALGLADVVVAAGIDTKGLAMMNHRGRRIALIDYGAHRQPVRGAVGHHRPRQAVVDPAPGWRQAAGLDLRFGAAIEDFAAGPAGVILGGGAGDADLLLGCDGLRSTVRAKGFPDAPAPHYTGLIGTGGFADAPEVGATGGLMNMVFGRRGFFGWIKQAGGPVQWFNTFPSDDPRAGRGMAPDAYAAFLRDLHRDDPPEIGADSGWGFRRSSGITRSTTSPVCRRGPRRACA